MSQITNEEERKQTQFCNLHEKEVERRNDKMDILFTKVDALHSDIVYVLPNFFVFVTLNMGAPILYKRTFNIESSKFHIIVV